MAGKPGYIFPTLSRGFGVGNQPSSLSESPKGMPSLQLTLLYLFSQPNQEKLYFISRDNISHILIRTYTNHQNQNIPHLFVFFVFFVARLYLNAPAPLLRQ
jgi:hypothetical protein